MLVLSPASAGCGPGVAAVPLAASSSASGSRSMSVIIRLPIAADDQAARIQLTIGPTAAALAIAQFRARDGRPRRDSLSQGNVMTLHRYRTGFCTPLSGPGFQRRGCCQGRAGHPRGIVLCWRVGRRLSGSSGSLRAGAAPLEKRVSMHTCAPRSTGFLPRRRIAAERTRWPGPAQWGARHLDRRRQSTRRAPFGVFELGQWLGHLDRARACPVHRIGVCLDE